MDNPRVQLLLRALDTGYDHKSWHGTILRGSLRGMTAQEAAWRPAPTATTSGSSPFMPPIGSTPSFTGCAARFASL